MLSSGKTLPQVLIIIPQTEKLFITPGSNFSKIFPFSHKKGWGKYKGAIFIPLHHFYLWINIHIHNMLWLGFF